MTTVNKVPKVQTYKVLLHQKALHPELFSVHKRRQIESDDYRIDSMALPGGHVLMFEAGGYCVTETVTDDDYSLPDKGLLQAIPCMGEREMEETVGNRIRYVGSMQTENLTENLYHSTYQEMLDFAKSGEALTFEWVDASNYKNLSILDLQRYKHEIHTQSFHLIAQTGFVLRTQAIFEIKGRKRAE